MQLSGTGALVTGAASGFGRETATLFGSEGASLLLVDLDAGGLEETCQQLEGSGTPVASVVEQPGTVVRADRGAIWIAAGEGAVELLRGQLEGKRAMEWLDLVNGRAVRVGDRLG